MIDNPVQPKIAIKFNHMIKRAFPVSPEHRRMSSITHMISAAFTWDCMTEFDKFVAMILKLADELVCESYSLLVDICGTVHNCRWKSEKDESLQYVCHLEILMKHLIIRKDKYIARSIIGNHRWILIVQLVLNLVLNKYCGVHNLHLTKLQKLFECNDIQTKSYCNTLKQILIDIEILSQQDDDICEVRDCDSCEARDALRSQQYWNDIFRLVHASAKLKSSLV